MEIILAAPAQETLGFGVIATAFFFGLRHGVDWDHIAAITDITGSQLEARRSLLLATLYALGHALVVFVLGVLAAVTGTLLPRGVDRAMEPFVGATLLALGLYLMYSLVRYGGDARLRSRWMLVIAGVRRLISRFRHRQGQRPQVVEIVHEHEHPVDARHHEPARAAAFVGTTVVSHAPVSTHRHTHRHVATMPQDPFWSYGRTSAFAVGMIHGIGAETPTQVLLFVAAAGVGGRAVGIIMVAAFVIGLLVTNTLFALASTFGFLGLGKSWPAYALLVTVTAAMSIVLGTLFLLGKSTVVPGFFAG